VTDPPRDELLGGADDAERDGLRHVHERLIAAGPPPELPPALLAPPEPPKASIVPLPRRYRYTTVAAAAALALCLFGAGYVIAGGDSRKAPVQQVALKGAGGASATLAVFEQDAAGNWPMELTTTRLPALPPGKTYELWLTRDGVRTESCGSFVTGGSETVVRLNAPYRLGDFSGWVVTRPDGVVALRTDTA
jgi:hypothetical protein